MHIPETSQRPILVSTEAECSKPVYRDKTTTTTTTCAIDATQTLDIVQYTLAIMLGNQMKWIMVIGGDSTSKRNVSQCIFYQ